MSDDEQPEPTRGTPLIDRVTAWSFGVTAAIVVVVAILVWLRSDWGETDETRATACASALGAPAGRNSATARVFPPGPVPGLDPLESDGFEIPEPGGDQPDGPTIGVFVDDLEPDPTVDGCRVTVDGTDLVLRIEATTPGPRLITASVEPFPDEIDTLVVNGLRFPVER